MKVILIKYFSQNCDYIYMYCSKILVTHNTASHTFVVIDRVCVWMFLVWNRERLWVVVSQCLERRGISFPLAEGREQWSSASQPVVCTACGCLVYRVVCPCVCVCVFPPRLADEETALLSRDWQPGPMPHWSVALGIFLIKHSHFYSIWDPTENTVPFRLTSCAALHFIKHCMKQH